MLSVDSAYRPMRWTFEVSFRSRALYTFLHISRVLLPTIIRQSTEGRAVLKRRGLMSFNFLWLLWAVCGGIFITNIINSNWLASTVKPKFAEKPVDTAQVRWARIMPGTHSFWRRMCLREGWPPSWSLVTTCGSTWCRRCPLLTQPFLNEWFLPQTGRSLMKWSIRIFWKRRVMLIPIFELTLYTIHIYRAPTPCCWARCRSRISRLRRRWARPGTAPGRSSPRTCPTLATSPTRSGRLLRNAANPTQQLYLWSLKTLK